MRDIVLNEKKTAAALLAMEAKVEDVRTAISLVARYDIQAANIDPETTAAHVAKTMKLLYSKHNLHRYERQIAYYVEHAADWPLSCIDGVPITQAELDAVATRSGIRAQCLAFAMLAIAKLDTMRHPAVDYWLNGDRWGEIVERANLTLTEDDLCHMIFLMYQDDMVHCGKRVGGRSRRVAYADTAGEPVMMLNDMDFRDLGYCYRAHIGEKYSRCEECGRWVRQKARGVAKRFCADCAADNQRALDAAYRRRKRS